MISVGKHPQRLAQKCVFVLLFFFCFGYCLAPGLFSLRRQTFSISLAKFDFKLHIF